MSNEAGTVECGTHGQRTATFVCQHLTGETEKQGFNIGYDPDAPDAHYPDAWCDECEEVWEAEGEWNEKSEAFANIKLVCGDCYEQIRERNWKPSIRQKRTFNPPSRRDGIGSISTKKRGVHRALTMR